MNEFYEVENYTTSELNNAKNSMTMSEAYDLVTQYYMMMNAQSELEKGRISPQKYKEYHEQLKARLCDSLEFIELGYGRNLGTELFPTTDAEFEKKMRNAFILVDNDYRQGKGRKDFIERFASVLPEPFINMVFVLAIRNQDERMLDAIASNDFDLFTFIDERLEKNYPDLRLKAIGTGFVYARMLLEMALGYINGNEKSSDFGIAADVYSLFNSTQRDNFYLGDRIQTCFSLAQSNCEDIHQYIKNKELYLKKVLKIKYGAQPDITNRVGTAPAFLLARNANVCTMNYAVEHFLDLFLQPVDEDSKGYENYQRELKDWSLLILKIDLDERITCRRIQNKTHKEQHLKRSPKEQKVIEFASGIVKERINSSSNAKTYIDMHDIGEEMGYEVPDPTIMKMIVEKYGTNPTIKELLFRESYGINGLWADVPYASIPDSYTIYEKMMAGVQILNNDFSRVYEIPEDIRNLIFSSKDCITRLLFPGMNYNLNPLDSIMEAEIGQFDRNKNANILLTQVLGKTSSQLKDGNFLDDIAKMYESYAKYKVNAAKYFDPEMALYIIFLNRHYKNEQPKSFLESEFFPFGKIASIDTSSEFIVEGEDVADANASNTQTYSQEELKESQRLFSLGNCLNILMSYYSSNKSTLIHKKVECMYEIQITDNPQYEVMESNRLLGTEDNLAGRGDLLRYASIYIDDLLFGNNPVSPSDLDACYDLVERYALSLPTAFMKRFNQLLKEHNKEPIQSQITIGNFGDEEIEFVVNTCRKFLTNKQYRDCNQIDAAKLANIINVISFDGMKKQDLVESGFQYLLMAMLACSARIKYPNGKDDQVKDSINIDVSKEISQANDIAMDVLTSLGFSIEEYEILRLVHYHKNLNDCYPMERRLVDSMMSYFYSSSKESRGADDNVIGKSLEIGKEKYKIQEMVKNEPTNAPNLFKNISPDAFLRWDLMHDELLMLMLTMMGKNNQETTRLLKQIVFDDDDTMLKKANEDMSPQNFVIFKKRIKRVGKRIFDTKEPKNREASRRDYQK